MKLRNCICCGIDFTKEEVEYNIKNDMQTCFPCNKGNCEICGNTENI